MMRPPWLNVRKKESWVRFLLKCLALTTISVSALAYFQSNYRIGVDSQLTRCMPDSSVFLIDLNDRVPERGAVLVFRSQGLAPIFEDGAQLAKIVTGMPGDRVEMNENGVFVNGLQVADGFPLSKTLETDEKSFYRSEVIPEGHYLMLAPAEGSYDSRYWGYVRQDQLVAKASPIW